VFCVPYLDLGQFNVLVFDQESEYCRINLNSALDIDESTRPIYGLPDPMINTCFLKDSFSVFVNILHRESMTHHQLVFDYETKQIIGEPVVIEMGSLGSEENFPHDNFFDETRNLIHCFYRLGQAIIV
jgi:hypothetical protein